MALGGFCVAMLRQGHHGRVATRVPRRFRAAAFRPVSKPKARSGIEDEAFSNRGRSSGSQTKDAEEMKMSKFSNRGRSSGSQTLWGLHVGKKNVQQPWQNMPFELGIPISKNCKICQVFLFLRPARSFFDQALGSPTDRSRLPTRSTPTPQPTRAMPPTRTGTRSPCSTTARRTAATSRIP